MSSVSKGVIYYTNNICDEEIFNTVLERLNRICVGMELISVSHKPVNFGKNIVVDLPSCADSILRQIYIGLLESTSDIIYLVEHDVLYHPSHFERIPRTPNQFLYNQNVWQVDSTTGEALYRKSKRTSQLVMYRTGLMEYLEKVFKRIEEIGGYSQRIGVSPGTHRIKGIDPGGLKEFNSRYPNVDIRHGNNLSEYIGREKREGGVPHWGRTKDRFNEFLKESPNVN